MAASGFCCLSRSLRISASIDSLMANLQAYSECQRVQQCEALFLNTAIQYTYVGNTIKGYHILSQLKSWNCDYRTGHVYSYPLTDFSQVSSTESLSNSGYVS